MRAAAAHDRSSYLGDLLLRSELAHMLKAAKQARPPARSGSRTDGRAAIDRTDRLRAAAAQRNASVGPIGAR